MAAIPGVRVAGGRCCVVCPLCDLPCRGHSGGRLLCSCSRQSSHQWSSRDEVLRVWVQHLQRGVDIFGCWLAALQSSEANALMSEWLVEVADVIRIIHHEELQSFPSFPPAEPLSVLLHFQSSYLCQVPFSASRVGTIAIGKCTVCCH